MMSSFWIWSSGILPIRSSEGERLFGLLVSCLPNPNALRRAARPGEGFRACLGFAGSGVIDGEGELSWDLQELL
jgi:hypothetical protein